MPSFEKSIEHLENLISFPSVSSQSNRPISDWVSQRLEEIGFSVEQMRYEDAQGVEKVNVLARRDPFKPTSSQSGGLAYFCHTDVVPVNGWNGPGEGPFCAHVQSDRIYGRGSCDMKGSLASMLSAAEALDKKEQRRPLWIVCTADEEVGFVGAKELVKNSDHYQELAAHQPLGLIGEPTRLNVVHAHKGIIGLRITSVGRAAHSSTIDGVNANRRMVPLLQQLLQLNEKTESDSRYMDDRFDPPTLSWNFGISDQCSAVNITPDRSVAWLSLRPMPSIDGSELIAEVVALADTLGLTVEYLGSGTPLWIDAGASCIQELCQITKGVPKTVCYGTDGGEFNALKHRVVFGPGDIAQAHTTDEWIALDQLKQGVDLFGKAIRHWCCDEAPAS